MAEGVGVAVAVAVGVGVGVEGGVAAVGVAFAVDVAVQFPTAYYRKEDPTPGREVISSPVPNQSKNIYEKEIHLSIRFL